LRAMEAAEHESVVDPCDEPNVLYLPRAGGGGYVWWIYIQGVAIARGILLTRDVERRDAPMVYVIDDVVAALLVRQGAQLVRSVGLP
jgi:hypothetical protein